MFFLKCFLTTILCAVLQSMVILSNNVGGVGVTTPTRMNTNATLKLWNLRLQKRSHLKSVFTDLEGEYSTENKALPNAIVVVIPSEAKNAWSYTYQIVMPLTGSGTFTGTLVNNEEVITTKTGVAYREECRHATVRDKYGSKFLEADAYKLYAQCEPLLADWNKEEYDLECHQAIHETYGETLYHNSTAATCIPNFNRNTFVLGYNTAAEGAVTYSSNPATYASSIAAKMAGANSGSLAPTISQILDNKQLGLIAQFLLNRRVAQLDLPVAGGKGWVVLVSNIMAEYMRNKTWSENNLGSLWTDTRALNDQAMKFDMVIGSYGKFLFIEDVRFSTALPAGSSAPYSLTTGYMWHGDNGSLRNLDDEDVREAILVLGKGAMWKNEPEPVHYVHQLDDYGKIEGVGTALVRGLGSMIYNAETPVDATSEQYSSAVVYAAHPRTTA